MGQLIERRFAEVAKEIESEKIIVGVAFDIQKKPSYALMPQQLDYDTVRIMEGFIQVFGQNRVRFVPISRNALITGIGLELYPIKEIDYFLGDVIATTAYLRRIGSEQRPLGYGYWMDDAFYLRNVYREPKPLGDWISWMKKNGMQNLFVKPATGKEFTGFIIDHNTDIMQYLHHCEVDCIASEVVDIVQEYRCFILNGKIIDIRPYGETGDCLPGLSFGGIFKDQLPAMTNAGTVPSAWIIDIGISEKHISSAPFVIETNDVIGGAFGTYGLDPMMCADLVITRWNQLLNRPMGVQK